MAPFAGVVLFVVLRDGVEYVFIFEADDDIFFHAAHCPLVFDEVAAPSAPADAMCVFVIVEGIVDGRPFDVVA